MPATVTEKEIEGYMDRKIETNTFDQADLIATEDLKDIEAAGSPDAARLKAIKINLVAHYVEMSNPSIVERRNMDGMSTQYARGDLGKDLEATFYGQTALRLDTSGALEKKQRGSAKIVAAI